MAKRKIAERRSAQFKSKVYYDSDYREYCVKFFVGKVMVSDYFTDDKADALATAMFGLIKLEEMYH